MAHNYEDKDDVKLDADMTERYIQELSGAIDTRTEETMFGYEGQVVDVDNNAIDDFYQQELERAEESAEGLRNVSGLDVRRSVDVTIGSALGFLTNHYSKDDEQEQEIKNELGFEPATAKVPSERVKDGTNTYFEAGFHDYDEVFDDAGVEDPESLLEQDEEEVPGQDPI